MTTLRELARRAWRRLVPEPPRLLFPYGHYLVSDRHRFVYCFVPKNASTALKGAFLAAQGVETGELTGLQLHEHADGPPYVLRLRPRDEALRILDTHFKYAFVRDPWWRLVSAYVSKLVRGREPRPQYEPTVTAIHRAAGRPVDLARGVTFREFVRHVHAAPDAALDPHWRPQACFLAGHRFDFVGRVEHLAEDLAELERRLGVALPLRQLNHTRYRASAGPCRADASREELRASRDLPLPESFYDEELVALVGERYRADVEAWGYSPPRPC